LEINFTILGGWNRSQGALILKAGLSVGALISQIIPEVNICFLSIC
jgi:hypothetical protein